MITRSTNTDTCIAVNTGGLRSCYLSDVQVCLVQKRRQLDQHGGESAAVQVASIVAQLKNKFENEQKI